ncbi:MAG: cobyrinate a,c-diamide synthase [Gemmataceae bacterium]
MSHHRFLIAGTHSGVGKTTVALALMAALRQRGLTVQPFKVGPDFIDPGHHTALCGRVSRNLDTWMLDETTNRQLFEHHAAAADVSVIEGVMGLFDGRGPDDARGSSADLARLLEVPIILVVDAVAVAGSIAATVKGFSEFDPAARVVGVICNRVAGPRHYAYLEPAIRRHTHVVSLGWLPRRAEWTIPERHLGLTTAEEFPGGPWDALGQALAATVDIDRLLALTTWVSGGRQVPGEMLPPGALQPPLARSRVAVARDAAFCFYYEDNLDLLRAAGAEVVDFSPLSDAELPVNTDLVYLGGGYPELHAERLAGNLSMLTSLRRYHQDGGAIYAECGGLMYCCRELVTVNGATFPMLDLLPARCVMQPRLAALGYVLWRGEETLLGPAGTELRGHEYHYSRLEELAPLTAKAHLHRDGQEPKFDGFSMGNLLAGYAHLHFASCPQVVASLPRNGGQP